LPLRKILQPPSRMKPWKRKLRLQNQLPRKVCCRCHNPKVLLCHPHNNRRKQSRFKKVERDQPQIQISNRSNQQQIHSNKHLKREINRKIKTKLRPLLRSSQKDNSWKRWRRKRPRHKDWHSRLLRWDHNRPSPKEEFQDLNQSSTNKINLRILMRCNLSIY
jgi:hypothetical protein